ncbi:MFS general substrate transporter [Mycena kentingensis (nom. inval.)]|nr:MFS general substrate transporter [Mycena kentingensis (nom. inval.)]
MSSIASTVNEKDEKHRDTDFTTTLEPVSEDSEHEVGYHLYKEAVEDGLTWTKKEEGRILRTIDWWILPCFCLTQGLAFLDKTALNYGNLFNMKASLHVNTAQYSWFASIFYIGYLIAAEPVTWMLQRYPTGRVLGIVCFFWGIVVMDVSSVTLATLISCRSTAATRSFAGMLVNRLILGILEACVTPGLGLMTPFWWKLTEQPVRHLTWYCFNGVAGIVGGFLAYGLGHATGARVPTWALIFLVLGAITTLWGATVFFILPDSPVSARFLDQRQKAIAIKRVAGNRTGTKNKVFKRYQMYQALRDPKTYFLFAASVAAQIPNGVTTNFSSAIISGMGFSAFETTLLDIPGSVVQIISLVLSGYLAGKFKNSRALMMFIGNATCIVAAAALTYAPKEQKWGRLVAFWFTSFASVGFSLSLVMVSANVGGFTKRQVTTVVTFVGYCIGNIIGPHVIKEAEKAAGYPTATKAMMAGYTVKTGCHIFLALYMWYENRARDRLAAQEPKEMRVSEEERVRLAEEEGMRDVTEFDNKWFRYVL